MASPVTTFTLDNGLRIAHQQDSAAAMVALNVLYDTGARDEDPSLTGMAHLVEHLMFSGSAHVADYDGELEAAGGTSNAWTSNDFTNFYAILPAVNAETAFRIESDRMLAPAINEENLRVQRSVVIEEFKQQCLNRPYGDLGHHLRALAYKVHPYRWPVIGLEPAHLERITLDDVMRYVKARYVPSNAVLAVTGNISASETLRLASKWMGDIPAGAAPRRSLPAEPEIDAPREAEATGRVPYTVITMAWPMAAYGEPEYFAADTITDVLANGRSSRFYRELMAATSLFNDVDASILGSEEPGLLMVRASLRDGGPDAERRALEAIRGQIDRIRESGVSDHELERAVNKYESTCLFDNLHYLHRARTIALDTMHGEEYGSRLSTYRAMSPADIRAAARSIFDPRKEMTLIYRPTDG